MLSRDRFLFGHFVIKKESISYCTDGETEHTGFNTELNLSDLPTAHGKLPVESGPYFLV